MDFIQLLGYAASFIIFISLTMKSIVKLRIVNAIGCVVFVLFALKTNSLPVVAMNIGIVFIDIYYLVRILRVKDSFEIVDVKKDNEIVQYFYEKNKEELQTLFGGDALKKSAHVAFYFRNSDVAGLVSYVLTDGAAGKTACILIDFVVPKYRDLAVGKHFLHDDTSYWHNLGCTALVVEQPAPEHVPYLKRLGFVQQVGSWEKALNGSMGPQ
ncbi:MAG: hypothetical protein ACTTJ7_08045 [Treponema sp.]